jgi:site-specific DNA-methyltransferase (adenine-specific)
MGELDSGSVDVIVTSPPYNRGKSYRSDDARSHDDAMPEVSYDGLLRRVFAECHRVLARDGVFFLNVGDAAQDQGKSARVRGIAESCGFTALQTIIWVKSLLGRGHYTPSGGLRRLNNLWENLFVLVKDKRSYRFDTKAIGIPYVDKSNIGRYSSDDCRDPGNVWLIPYARTTGQRRKKGHDAPFPVELPRRCIRLVPEARRVLDPFVGSGTTLVACRDLGVEGVGYELYPRRALIREVLERAEEPSPPTLLLPHLEDAVSLLAEALEVPPESRLHASLTRLSQSRRGRARLAALGDVITGLGSGGELGSLLESLLDEPEAS